MKKLILFCVMASFILVATAVADAGMNDFDVGKSLPKISNENGSSEGTVSSTLLASSSYDLFNRQQEDVYTQGGSVAWLNVDLVYSERDALLQPERTESLANPLAFIREQRRWHANDDFTLKSDPDLITQIKWKDFHRRS